jgi:hypothetical protein
VSNTECSHETTVHFSVVIDGESVLPTIFRGPCDVWSTLESVTFVTDEENTSSLGIAGGRVFCCSYRPCLLWCSGWTNGEMWLTLGWSTTEDQNGESHVSPQFGQNVDEEQNGCTVRVNMDNESMYCLVHCVCVLVENF